MEKLISVGTLFQKSFEIYQQKLWTVIHLILLSILTIIPVPICFLLIYFLRNNLFIMLFLVFIALLVIIGAIILSFLLKISLLIAVTRQDTLSLRQYVSMSWNLAASYIFLSLLTGLTFLGGFLLFIIPGIIFAVWFGLACYVLLVENIKGWPAMVRSKELVKGYWWPVFGRFLLVIVLMGAISSIPFLGPMVNVFFLTPLCIIYGYLIYEDLKRIKSATGIA